MQSKKVKRANRQIVTDQFDPLRNSILNEHLFDGVMKVWDLPCGTGKTHNLVGTLTPALRRYMANLLGIYAPTKEIAEDIPKWTRVLNLAGFKLFHPTKNPIGNVILLDPNVLTLDGKDPRSVENIRKLRRDYGYEKLIIVPATYKYLHDNSELLDVFIEHENRAICIYDECHAQTSTDAEAAADATGTFQEDYVAWMANNWYGPLQKSTNFQFMVSATINNEQRRLNYDADGNLKFVLVSKKLDKKDYQQLVSHYYPIQMPYASGDIDIQIKRTNLNLQDLLQKNKEVDNHIQYLNQLMPKTGQNLSVYDAFPDNKSEPGVFMGFVQHDKKSKLEKFLFETVHDAVAKKKIHMPEGTFYITTDTKTGTTVYNHLGQPVTPSIKTKRGVPKWSEFPSDEGHRFREYLTHLDCWKSIINDFPEVIALFAKQKGIMGTDISRITHTMIYGPSFSQNDHGYITRPGIQKGGRGSRQHFGSKQLNEIGWEMFEKLPMSLQKMLYDNYYCQRLDFPECDSSRLIINDLYENHIINRNDVSIYEDEEPINSVSGGSTSSSGGSTSTIDPNFSSLLENDFDFFDSKNRKKTAQEAYFDLLEKNATN